jgi:hypothetical protein
MVPGKQGFFSGMVAVDAILPDPPTWQIRVNDTAPIFFYCSAPGSCIDWQMVGVINPVSDQPFPPPSMYNNLIIHIRTRRKH